MSHSQISIPVFFVGMVDHRTAKFQFAPPVGEIEVQVSDAIADGLKDLEWSKFELRPVDDSEDRSDAMRAIRNAAEELRVNVGTNRTSDELDAAADWIETKL